MDPSVRQALDLLRYNRKSAEATIAAVEQEINGHTHTIGCFYWRSCRKKERFVQRTRDRIGQYQEAEDGIQAGNYEKAIELFTHMADQLQETPWEIAIRLRNTPVLRTTEGYLEEILSSPTVLSQRLRKLAEELAELVHQDYQELH